jgi:peptidoglycan/xylan/chitin deacetylase (PgdA/CDA1 family)
MLQTVKSSLVAAVDRVGTRFLSPPNGGSGFYRNHGSRQERKIALTFDDGPSRPCTEVLLDALGEVNAPATFFVVGENAIWHPDLIQRAYDEGHEIGNHSMHHSRKAGLLLTGGAHIDENARQIAEVIGREPRLYRPPWGWLTPWEGRRLHQRGYTIVGWDVYTLDWHWPEEDGIEIAEKARLETQPGSILLFHDANAGVKIWDKKETVRAIKQIVPALRADGYDFVTASDILQVSPYANLKHEKSITAS